MSTKHVVVDNPGSSGFFRFLKLALLVFVVLALVCGLALGVWLHSLAKDLPHFASVEEYHPVLGSTLYADTGAPIADFSIEKRQIVPFERIPRLLILAFVAAEDENFFQHFGVDPLHVLRAAWKNLKAGHFKEGASTITMQLARTFFLSREKKLTRKLREVILAITELERNLTKDEILWLYLNQIYLGHGAYGVQQASKIYYGKNVWDITLPEMAVLAGLPKAPGRDSPYVNPEKARGRKAYVLRRLFEEKYISAAERDAALAEPIVLHQPPDLFLESAPHFSEHVRKYIYDTYGEDMLYKGGLHVTTTMNFTSQVLAQEAVAYGLRRLTKRQGWFGPVARLPREQRAEFLANTEARYTDALPRRNRVYYGLVTRVDDAKKITRVRVANWEADIRLASMSWARKPNIDVFWEWVKLNRPSQALKVGDVVMVRPSDPKNVEDAKDFRSDAPIDPEKMVWELEQEPRAQAALIAKEPDTGYTVAMVGGYNFERSEFNRAIQACRQPGSAFKPVVYTAAIDKGWTVSSPIIDSPIVDGEWKWKWKPENYGEDFKGEVSLRYALQHSLNIPAIKTIDHFGVSTIIDYARRMGVKSAIAEDRSISLGSACMTPEDLVDVYAHFPLFGKKPKRVYVKTIMTSEGELLEDNRAYFDPSLDTAETLSRLEAAVLEDEPQIIPATTAFILTWLLEQVVQGGTGSGARALGRSCAGKTGTTNDAYDAWFAGYVPQLATVVWIGHDDNSRPLGRLETGGRAALPIWLDFMKRALEDVPVMEFEAPEGIHWVRVEEKDGRRVPSSATGGVKAPFKTGTNPPESAGGESGVNPDEFLKMSEIY